MTLKKSLAAAVASMCLIFGSNACVLAATNETLPQNEIEVTIYNNNLALVKDKRTMKIPLGLNTVNFDDISDRINASSVTFKSLTSPDDVNIREQNYEYDIVNEYKLMEKFLGQKVTVTTKGGTSYTGYLLSTSGTVILSAEKGGAGGVFTVQSSDIQSIQYPSLPQGLITKPTLAWLINNNSGTVNHDVLVTYLTGGLSWNADYVATLSADEDYIDLTGWVTLTNNTNMTFEDAKLKLVAGDINTVTSYMTDQMVRYESASVMAKNTAAGFTEKEFFDYHLYDLQYPTTIKASQTKQIELLSASKIPVTKKYVFDGLYNDKVQVLMEFKNDEKSNLGMPLPKGTIRVSKSDDDGSLEFIGEDSIDHTPRDEEVEVTLGNAFDVTGTRTRVSSRKTGSTSREDTYEIVIKNHKDSAVDVTVVEHLGGWESWEIVSSSSPYEKVDSNTVNFVPTVDADGTVTISYTVELSWYD